MRIRRTVKWVSLAVLLVVAALAVTSLALARRRPGDYAPLALTEAQKKASQENLNRKLANFVRMAGEIGSYRAGEPVPPGQSFTVEVTQQEMNEWVASLPDAAVTQLARLGLSDPAVALGDGKLTFYAYWAKLKGVAGIDFAFRFDKDGLMRLELRSIRMGELRLPRSLYDDLVRRLEQDLQARLSAGGSGSEEFGGIPLPALRKAAKKLLDTLHGKPVRPDIHESFGKVRIADIKLTKGLMTMRVVSLLEEGAEALPAGLPPDLREATETGAEQGAGR